MMIVGGYQMFINGSQWLVIRFLVTNGDYYYRSMRPALKKILGWDQVLEDFFKIILIFTIIFMLTSANES